MPARSPMPAPPVKIQRGTATKRRPGDPPAQARPSPAPLLQGLARRLFFGGKTAFKLLLLARCWCYGGVQL